MFYLIRVAVVMCLFTETKTLKQLVMHTPIIQALQSMEANKFEASLGHTVDAISETQH